MRSRDMSECFCGIGPPRFIPVPCVGLSMYDCDECKKPIRTHDRYTIGPAGEFHTNCAERQVARREEVAG